MISALSVVLIIGVLLAAIFKRGEMSLWLLLISAIGVAVSFSNSSPDELIIFFCGANLILMRASFSIWKITRLNLPFLIGVLACFDVVVGFIHLLHLINVGVVSYYIGIITGTIGYIQLMLVLLMKDSRGVMNDILNDFGHSIHRFLHLGRHNNNSGYRK